MDFSRTTAFFQNEKKSAQDYVLVFAMRIFVAADNEDRAERADKRTAQNFFAAANFFEVATQFGELPPQVHHLEHLVLLLLLYLFRHAYEPSEETKA